MARPNYQIVFYIVVSWLIFFLIVYLGAVAVLKIRDKQYPKLPVTSVEDGTFVLKTKEDSMPLPSVIAIVSKSKANDEILKSLESTKNMVVELGDTVNCRIDLLEISDKKRSFLISDLQNEVTVFNQKVKDVVKLCDLLDKKIDFGDRKANDRIDIMFKELNDSVTRIKVLEVQVTKSCEDIKDLYVKHESQETEIGKNKEQIENIKNLFYNYDAVLAIEKAKKCKK